MVPQLEEVVKVLGPSAKTPKKLLRGERISRVRPKSFSSGQELPLTQDTF